MPQLTTRGVIHRGALLGALWLAACSFQNFDSLSNGGTGSLGTAGSAGAATSGTGGDAGSSGAGGAGGSGGNGGTRPDTGGTGGSAGTAGRSGAGGAGPGGPGNGPGGNGSVPTDAGATGNLFADPGFELGHLAWKQFGTTRLTDVPGEGRNGTKALRSDNRADDYAGPSTTIAPPLTEAGAVYRVEGWVRMLEGSASVRMTVKTVCGSDEPAYVTLDTQVVNATDYTLLSANVTVATCTLTEYLVYFEGPDPGVSFYLDDVGLYPVQ